MSKKNKKKEGRGKERPSEESRNRNVPSRPGAWGRLREETRNSIVGVVFVLLAIILLFAAAGKGGFLGNSLYGGFHFLLGFGYYTVPLLFIVLSINFFRAGGHNITTPSLIAGPFFLLSSLGLLALLDKDAGVTGWGGWVGWYTMFGAAYLFDVILTGVILATILLVTILFLFDVPLHLGFFTLIGKIFGKKEVDEEGFAEEIDDGTPVLVDTGEEKEGKLAAMMAGASALLSRGGKDESGEVEKDDIDEKEEKEHEAPARTELAPAKDKDKGDDVGAFNLFLHRPFTPPPLSLLAGDKGKPSYGDIKGNANIIKRTLQNYSIEVEMDEVAVGPTITRYALKPAEGVRLSKIVALQRELEYALALSPLRIEAPIPGKSLVGIEVPNSVKATVGLAALISDPAWSDNPNPLYVPLGKGISGAAQYLNIAKAPHTLVAGTTGSGKSVAIHTIIASLLYRNGPEQMRFIMVDPKRVELTLYNGIPHLLTPVITDAKKAILTLKWAAKEMDRRYDILQRERCRDIQSYHKTVVAPALARYEKEKAAAEKRGEETEELLEMGENENVPELMPFIVVVIDELADIMQAYPRELESAIVRLAQMSRAVGIHLILSTQRPSVNVITGLIKANIPTRVALQVASQIDSRTILDMAGAENLLGAGDMLFLSADMPKPVRLQSAFISETEVKAIVRHIKKNYEGVLGAEINIAAVANEGNGMETMTNEVGQASAQGGSSLFTTIPDDDLVDHGDEDDMYEEAKKVVIESQKASTSFLQRRLGLGYARAARIVDTLEQRGVVGPGSGAKPREVLMKPGE